MLLIVLRLITRQVVVNWSSKAGEKAKDDKKHKHHKEKAKVVTSSSEAEGNESQNTMCMKRMPVPAAAGLEYEVGDMIVGSWDVLKKMKGLIFY